jgi:NAD(P)-dependent dehydrogenase (short-subunit alcohol dehydrogenase family)
MLQLDTGRIDEFPAFYAEVKSTLADTFDCGDFDFLVNNAGGSASALFVETTQEQFDEVFNEHVKGPYFLSQALLPLMVDGGRIVTSLQG